jgi:hypothetical protein
MRNNCRPDAQTKHKGTRNANDTQTLPEILAIRRVASAKATANGVSVIISHQVQYRLELASTRPVFHGNAALLCIGHRGASFTLSPTMASAAFGFQGLDPCHHFVICQRSLPVKADTSCNASATF